jgi:CRP/FNR family transcriptional regulator, nitrogen fixation regulation protein
LSHARSKWRQLNVGAVTGPGSAMTIRVQERDQFGQRIGVIKSFARKNEIVREGDPHKHVYEVISGTVCTCKALKNGRRQIAGFYFAGDVFGLEAAETHNLTAQAITDAKVRLVKKQQLNSLATSNSTTANRLLWLTSTELARQQELILLLSRSARERVIYFLVAMAERVSIKDRMVLPMARTDIADYLALTLETVSRVFWELERRGGIELSGRRNVMLRSGSANKKAKVNQLIGLFEGTNGRRPKTDGELDDWLGSPEGKAATLFDLMSAEAA